MECLGNPLKIARYMNIRNKALAERVEGEWEHIAFKDVIEFITELPAERLKQLESSLEVKFDEIAIDELESGASGFKKWYLSRRSALYRDKQETSVNVNFNLEGILQGAGQRISHINVPQLLKEIKGEDSEEG